MPVGEHNGNEIISLARLRANIKVRPHKGASLPSRSLVARTTARTHCFGRALGPASLWFHAIITTCSPKKYSGWCSCSYSGWGSPPTGSVERFSESIRRPVQIYSLGDMLTCRPCRRRGQFLEAQSIRRPISSHCFRAYTKQNAIFGTSSHEYYYFLE